MMMSIDFVHDQRSAVKHRNGAIEGRADSLMTASVQEQTL